MQKLLKSLRSTKGFTLIELLIVIAVLGVLAAVVLTAINPGEQLARGRDSSRVQEVAQLGHAVSSYYTAQNELLSGWPAAAICSSTGAAVTYGAGNWQTVLTCSQDLGSAITAPTNSACGITGATNGSEQNNLCYGESGSSNFFVWTLAESSQAKTKAGCAAGTVAHYIYKSSEGRAGIGCLASDAAPVAGTVIQ